MDVTIHQVTPEVGQEPEEREEREEREVQQVLVRYRLLFRLIAAALLVGAIILLARDHFLLRVRASNAIAIASSYAQSDLMYVIRVLEMEATGDSLQVHTDQLREKLRSVQHQLHILGLLEREPHRWSGMSRALSGAMEVLSDRERDSNSSRDRLAEVSTLLTAIEEALPQKPSIDKRTKLLYDWDAIEQANQVTDRWLIRYPN